MPKRVDDLPPDDSIEPALTTPRRLAGELLRTITDLSAITARIRGLAAYVDCSTLRGLSRTLDDVGSTLGDLRGEVLVGQLAIVAGRDEAAGRERYPLLDRLQAIVDPSARPSGSHAEGELLTGVNGTKAELCRTLHGGNGKPKPARGGRADRRVKATSPPVNPSAPEGRPAPGLYRPEELGITLTADQLGDKHSMADYHHGRPTKLRALVMVRGCPYAVIGGLYHGAYSEHCLIPAVPREEWKGPTGGSERLNSVSGHEGILATHRGKEYVLGHKNEELRVAYGEDPARETAAAPPGIPEAWRDLPTASLAIPKELAGKLVGLGFKTVGELDEFTNDDEQDFADLNGISPPDSMTIEQAILELIEEAEARATAAPTPTPAAAVDLTEACAAITSLIELHDPAFPAEDSWRCVVLEDLELGAVFEDHFRRLGHLTAGAIADHFELDDVRRCRVCGCTDADCSQCVEKTGEPCSWVEADLCSACVETAPAAEDPGPSPATSEPQAKEWTVRRKGRPIDVIFAGDESEAFGRASDTFGPYKLSVTPGRPRTGKLSSAKGVPS